MANNQNYLTEFILSIHHEIQSAVDFISSVSAKEGTEFGMNESLMQIENLRVKLPFSIEMETKTKDITKVVTLIDNADTPAKMRSLLASRSGFMIDIGATGKMGSYTKLKVTTTPNQTEDSAETLRGEIEIMFSPLQRQ